MGGVWVRGGGLFRVQKDMNIISLELLDGDKILRQAEERFEDCATFQRTVMLELPAAIVGLGRRREHFPNERRVEQRVLHCVEELRLAADNYDIRIAVKSGGRDVDPHITAVPTTSPRINLRSHYGGELEHWNVNRLWA